MTSFSHTLYIDCYAPAPRAGGIKRWNTSDICLLVAYIGPKSRTESPRKTKIGTEVAHVARDSDTIFKVKRSKFKVTGERGILWRPPAQLVTGRMSQSGNLSVVNLLTGQKSGFSPRRSDLHRFKSNLAGPTGIWVRLAVQNFTSIATGGGNAAPKISKISTFWQRVAPQGRLPWPIWKIFRGFYTPNYPTWVFQISCDSHHRLRNCCWETARRSIRPNFSVHPVGKTMRWIKKWMTPFCWARRALSPCKVWVRSHNTRRL